MPVVTDVIGFAIVIYFIVRQVRPRQPSRLRFYILPVIALVIAYQDFPRPVVPSGQIEDAIVSLLISIPFGILQARFTVLYQQNGTWLMKGDWRYLVSWCVLLAMHIATTWLFRPTPDSAVVVVGWIIALEVAVVWGLRSLVLHLRYPELRTILQSAQRSR